MGAWSVWGCIAVKQYLMAVSQCVVMCCSVLQCVVAAASEQATWLLESFMRVTLSIARITWRIHMQDWPSRIWHRMTFIEWLESWHRMTWRIHMQDWHTMTWLILLTHLSQSPDSHEPITILAQGIHLLCRYNIWLNVCPTYLSVSVASKQRQQNKLVDLVSHRHWHHLTRRLQQLTSVRVPA